VHRVSEDFKRFADYREKETGPRKQINRKAYERKLEIMDFMGLQFMTQRGDKLEKSLPGVPFSINRRGGDIVGVIGGYDFRLPAIQNITVSMSKQKQWERVFAASVEDGVPEIKLSFDTDGMLKAQIGTQGTLFFNVTEYSKRERGADTGLSSIDAVDGSLKGRILIQSVRGKVDGENLYVEGLSFVLLLDI
jgi:hypothetical protein